MGLLRLAVFAHASSFPTGPEHLADCRSHRPAASLLQPRRRPGDWTSSRQCDPEGFVHERAVLDSSAGKAPENLAVAGVVLRATSAYAAAELRDRPWGVTRWSTMVSEVKC